jgi:hypothetical protein
MTCLKYFPLIFFKGSFSSVTLNEEMWSVTWCHSLLYSRVGVLTAFKLIGFWRVFQRFFSSMILFFLFGGNFWCSCCCCGLKSGPHTC